MTAPFLSLAQIRNRLILTARTVLRQHRPGPDGHCRTPDCPVATAARNVLRTAEEVQQRSTATSPTEPDRDDPQQAR
ncbi:hypothetical protein [Micromonospora cathayae]|uniref:Uncharacterized protein n=1 Tax=Micromonospora cathayae TaxID=3028804 RepID=A0ABY8A174_9ACTN|nr:hypothetical protein [Micromonospora sp. HUAS 3]WDZ87744.1 hypothetical protein PVK37_15730 [Micromonospora sp. HUAS 3]